MWGDPFFWALLARITSAAIWLVLLYRVDRWPVTGLARRMTLSVVVLALVAFSIGGLTPFGFPAEYARWINTIVATYAGIVGLAILTTERD